MNDTIVVFTAKSAARIIREGGTSSWRLDPANARRCTYAVCVRNAHSNWGDGTEAHHTAFLIGKVSGVVPTEPTPENDEAPQDRYLIQFSEYAELNVPESWPKGYRNPVRYSMIGDELLLDPTGLDWKPMPEATEAPTPEGPVAPAAGKTNRPLTIAEAKQGLALTFGVPTEAVEITIRG
jgi:hypothetical protein